MTSKSKLASGLAAVALVLVSASPADARGYSNRWHSRHHDGVDAGAVFGVLLGVGILAAIASSASKDRNATDRRVDDRRYDPRYDERRADDRGYDPRDYDTRSADDRAYDSGSANYASEDAAVDACAVAARDEASRSGDFAEIRDITGAQPYGNGWDVTGTLDQRGSYRASDSQLRSFRCIWEDGRVSGVTFG